jgi:hypothetical protein
MARYAPAICTDKPETISAQPGQWVNVNGAKGRYMGRRNGCIWIAWGTTATQRFPRFAAIFHGNPSR